MNTGQTMMTILGVLLLSVTILTVNRGQMATNATVYQNRSDILAISLANSILEEASGLAFDQNTSDDPSSGITKAVTLESQLTPPSALGIETSKGELASKPGEFNDFDDFNCYRTKPKVDFIEIPGSNKKIVLNTLCSVDYIDEHYPNKTSSTATWHKRLRIKVWHPELYDPGDPYKETDTIRLTYVYSYWYFR